MTVPDLALIPDLIVTAIRNCPDLAALTTFSAPDVVALDEAGIEISAVVGINKADLQSAISANFARLSVCVTVLIMEAGSGDDAQSNQVIYDPVKVLVEVVENTLLNMTTAESTPPGTGSGLQAWQIADRIVATLQNQSLAGLARPYRVFLASGVVNRTNAGDLENGQKRLWLHFKTTAESIPR